MEPLEALQECLKYVVDNLPRIFSVTVVRDEVATPEGLYVNPESLTLDFLPIPYDIEEMAGAGIIRADSLMIVFLKIPQGRAIALEDLESTVMEISKHQYTKLMDVSNNPGEKISQCFFLGNDWTKIPFEDGLDKVVKAMKLYG